MACLDVVAGALACAAIALAGCAEPPLPGTAALPCAAPQARSYRIYRVPSFAEVGGDGYNPDGNGGSATG